MRYHSPLPPLAELQKVLQYNSETGVFTRNGKAVPDLRDCPSIAAALRAAADQTENVHPANPSTEWGEGWLEGVQDVVAGFRRIATELEVAND